ncbi:DUF2637 domain-containing protein [Streptomyces sulphureus]|uniref:DUF2637 domain-containing protein n=1 Tax=Streptomyces sulphureus TaxID=47758 RepID=UPI0003AA6B5B|nr:DUF2637 domain-containing protein [Streptomyces sulphureus]
MQAVQLTRIHRVLIAVVVTGAVVIAAIGFAGSFSAVRDLAEKKGFGDFAPFFPIGIDAGIVVLLALDLLLTWIRIPFPLLRQSAWLLTAATIAFNGAAAWPDPLGVGMHAVIPLLFVVTVEAARHAIGRIADLTADRHMEGVRVSRWLLAFPSTFRLWRRMKLWELRSYDEVIRMEQERLIYEARLRARYGRAWRRKAPVESLMPLKLARYGIPLTETAPAGLAAAGLERTPHPQLTAAASPDARTAVAGRDGTDHRPVSGGNREPEAAPDRPPAAESAVATEHARRDGAAAGAVGASAHPASGDEQPAFTAGASAQSPAEADQFAPEPFAPAAGAGAVPDAAPGGYAQPGGRTPEVRWPESPDSSGGAPAPAPSADPSSLSPLPHSAGSSWTDAPAPPRTPEPQAASYAADSTAAPQVTVPVGSGGRRRNLTSPPHLNGSPAHPGSADHTATEPPPHARQPELFPEPLPGPNATQDGGALRPADGQAPDPAPQPVEPPDAQADAEAEVPPSEEPLGIPEGVARDDIYYTAYLQYAANSHGHPTARQLSRLLYDEFNVTDRDGNMLSETYLRPYTRDFKERYRLEMGMG